MKSWKIFRISFMLATLVFSIVGSAMTTRGQGGGQKPPFESELRVIYPKLDRSLRGRDLKGLTAYYDMAYTLETGGKHLDRTQAVDQWKSLLGFLKQVEKLSTKIEAVAFRDGKYTVDYSQASSGLVQFPGSPVLPFTYTSKITDTWTRSAKGVWRIMYSVEHVSDLKVNGESSRTPN